jgi:hypothetical protein
MHLNAILKKLRALAPNAKGAIVQDCPPELSACEACGEFDCSNEEWLNCRRRLAAAQGVESGERQALAESDQLRIAREGAPCCKVQAADHTVEAGPRSV